MEKIVGLIDAPFTPMLANGDVNLAPIGAYAAMLRDNGLKGVFINGSSGEGYMLTVDERMALAVSTLAVAACARACAWPSTPPTSGPGAWGPWRRRSPRLGGSRSL